MQTLQLTKWVLKCWRRTSFARSTKEARWTLVLYGLQLVKNPSVVIQRVNGAHLKPYQTPLQSPASSFASSSASHNQSHDSRLLSEEGESLANSVHNSFTSKEDNSTPASDDSIPPLPPPMPPLNLLIGALRPESSIPPAKKPHISPAPSKHDNTFIVDYQPADLTHTKCP